jgi:RimJ/RimL family protein N-acetyltransferase
VLDGSSYHTCSLGWWGASETKDICMATLEGTASVLTLTDGAGVLVRDAQCDDWEALRRMYLGLSDRTRYLYFCTGVPANDAWAERFAALGRTDGQVSYALVVTVDNEVIGFARFDRGADGQSAEIGLLLADEWQSRGLGRLVLNRLTHEARRRAIGVFTAHALWENRRVLRLVRGAFPHMSQQCSQGDCDLMMYFD